MIRLDWLRHHHVLSLVSRERLRQEDLRDAGTIRQTAGDVAKRNPELALAILVEEVGEVSRLLCDRVNERTFLDGKRLREELIQVAAIAVSWVEGLEP